MTSSALPIVEVRHVERTYTTASGGKLPVLVDANLSVARGEVVAITGESGSGKSTLLHIMGALDRPDAGTVLFEGRDMFAADDEALSSFRNQSVGFVFQFHHLLPEFSALENVLMPALIAGRSGRAARTRAAELLATVGLSDRAEHRPAELSGGEKQRVAIARALMNGPDVVLADEPTGNLDAKTADILHNELIRLSRELGQTFVLVTHNPAFAAMADRTVLLEQGTLHAS